MERDWVARLSKGKHEHSKAWRMLGNVQVARKGMHERREKEGEAVDRKKDGSGEGLAGRPPIRGIEENGEKFSQGATYIKNARTWGQPPRSFYVDATSFVACTYVESVRMEGQFFAYLNTILTNIINVVNIRGANDLADFSVVASRCGFIVAAKSGSFGIFPSSLLTCCRPFGEWAIVRGFTNLQRSEKT